MTHIVSDNESDDIIFALFKFKRNQRLCVDLVIPNTINRLKTFYVIIQTIQLYFVNGEY